MYVEDQEFDDNLLYQVWSDSPDGWRHFDGFFDGQYCPDLPDPYPFIVGAMPAWFLEKYPHPYRQNAEDYWLLLEQEGVDELVWRRQPTHIGRSSPFHPELFSNEVLEAMEELSPRSWKSEYSFLVTGPTGRTQLTYNRVFPVNEVEGCLVVETKPETFVFDGHRSFLRSEFSRRERLGVTETRIVAQSGNLPFGIFRMKEFGWAPRLATADFIRRWKRTEISQLLRKSHFEDDFLFVPFEPYPGVVVRIED